MRRIGEVFKEANSDSVAIIVLEGDQPLGEDAHKYYDELIRQLKADTTHVQHIQDFWGDPIPLQNQNPLNRVLTAGVNDNFGLDYDKEKYKEMLLDAAEMTWDLWL